MHIIKNAYHVHNACMVCWQGIDENAATHTDHGPVVDLEIGCQLRSDASWDSISYSALGDHKGHDDLVVRHERDVLRVACSGF